MSNEDQDRSVLGDVTSAPWDPQAEASYEAAMEAINRMAGSTRRSWRSRPH